MSIVDLISVIEINCKLWPSYLGEGTLQKCNPVKCVNIYVYIYFHVNTKMPHPHPTLQAWMPLPLFDEVRRCSWRPEVLFKKGPIPRFSLVIALLIIEVFIKTGFLRKDKTCTTGRSRKPGRRRLFRTTEDTSKIIPSSTNTRNQLYMLIIMYMLWTSPIGRPSHWERFCVWGHLIAREIIPYLLNCWMNNINNWLS